MGIRIGYVIGLFLLSSWGWADTAPVKQADHESTTKPIAVVELFTSQGCYSCPPADKQLGELAKRDYVIALSCHVTYWNYLGWKDTFSRSFCDTRQRQYQAKLKGGTRGVYTPQMVINGRYAAIGSRSSSVEQLIRADIQQQVSVKPIDLTLSEGQLSISLPELDSNDGQYQLLILGTTGSHLLPIDRGENSGKRLPYHHPIEYVKHPGVWGGGSSTALWQLPQQSHVKAWVVLAQAYPLGEIVAAGRWVLAE